MRKKRLIAGIRAAQSGQTARARDLLESVLQQDSQSELAWIWLASVVDSKRERRICFEKVLQINPDNRPAQQALNNIVGVLSDSAEIDYNAISRAAKEKIQVERPKSEIDERELRARQANRNTDNNGLILIGLGALATVLVGALLYVSLIEPLIQLQNPPTEVIVPTNTRRPASPIPPTPNIVFITRDPNETINDVINTPTALPTASPTPSPSPTATPPPVESYPLLFTAIAGGDAVPALYRLDLVDGTPRRLVGDVREVSYNADTNQIAFIRDAAGEDGTIVPQAFTASLDDPLQATQVTNFNSGGVSGVSFAPGGVRLVIASSHEGNDDIYTLDTGSGVLENISRTEGDSEIDPYWTDNGRTILFSSTRERGTYDIFAFDSEISTIEKAINARGENLEAEASSDGRYIAYINRTGFNPRAFVQDTRLGRQFQLIDDPNAIEAHITFTPDSNYIMVVSIDPNDTIAQIYVFNTDGEFVTQISTSGLDVQTVDVLPN